MILRMTRGSTSADGGTSEGTGEAGNTGKLCKRSVAAHIHALALTHAHTRVIPHRPGPIHAELCNLHTRRMEMRVFRARARNCRLVYFILHRPSMIQLSRVGGTVVPFEFDVVSAYPPGLPMKCKYET